MNYQLLVAASLLFFGGCTLVNVKLLTTEHNPEESSRVNASSKPLSVRGSAIQTYKSRANNEGVVAWVDVARAKDIIMHIPKFEIKAIGSEEINTKVFGLLAEAGISQTLVAIHELGNYVTCYLKVTDGESQWDSVEVFLFNENNEVIEIWAL
jgi:hypothetical protein